MNTSYYLEVREGGITALNSFCLIKPISNIHSERCIESTNKMLVSISFVRTNLCEVFLHYSRLFLDNAALTSLQDETELRKP